MSKYEITKTFSNTGTRNEIRMRVIDEFSKEEPGQGKDALASRYTYFVETLQSGKRIFLSRPAYMHNGFDFVVRVEGENFARQDKKRRDAPSHNDIISDLEQKRKENPLEYARYYLLVKDVYECRDVSDDELSNIHFQRGLSAELSLKVIKWLFIEQDVRYWNYSGRNTLWSYIPKPV